MSLNAENPPHAAGHRAASGPSEGCVVVCTSPKAGSGRGREKIPELIRLLQSQGFDVLCSDNLREIVAAVQAAKVAGLRAVIPAGGDGTIALIADLLPPGTPLVPFPLGTENLLSRYFGFTSDPLATLHTVRSGPLKQLDAGRANGKLFLVMASCGFDAEVVRGMHLTRRGHIGRWSYVKPIVRALRNYRYPQIFVSATDPRADNPSAEPMPVDSTAPRPPAAMVMPAAMAMDCRWAMAFNLPCYGGGLRIEREARGDDGLLDLCALQYGSTLSTLRYVGGVYSGVHHRWKDVGRHRGGEWFLWSDTRVSYQLDGDYAGRLPLHLECLPQRLTLRMPPQ